MHAILHLGQTLGAFVLILSVIVFIHEFGHYIVAKACGVGIQTFSIGFGRELVGFTDRSGTRWRLSLLPLGGYVRMVGDAGPASNADHEALRDLSAEERTRAFHFKPLWQKALVVLAGPVANFLLAIAIFFGFLMANGIVSTEPVVGDVLPGSAAQEAGFQAGDKILNVDGQEVSRFNDIPFAIMPNLGTPIPVRLQRGEQTLLLTVTPHVESVDDGGGHISNQGRLGIKSQIQTVADVGVLGALKESVGKIWQISAMSLRVVGQIITGHRTPSELAGPVGIAKMSGDAAQSGWQTILWFIALLSVNLGMVNLFPIPMLDGGHLVFYALEAVRGRPLPQKFVEYSFRVGTAMLAMLMAYTFMNDVLRLANGS